MARGRVVLVGEAPGAKGDPLKPLEGRPGLVLCKLAGWERDVNYIRTKFRVLNVLDAYPGAASGKGTVWPLMESREAAARLLPGLRRSKGAVLLGKRVAAAFGIRGASYCSWSRPTEHVPCPHVVIPHPSGVNRRLNEKKMRKKVGEVLREAAEL